MLLMVACLFGCVWFVVCSSVCVGLAFYVLIAG